MATDALRGARRFRRRKNDAPEELDLAARMAAQSCNYMLWQQALAAGESGRMPGLATGNGMSCARIDVSLPFTGRPETRARRRKSVRRSCGGGGRITGAERRSGVS